MEKVKLYKDDVLVFEGNIKNANIFLGKHKHYLNHIHIGVRSVPNSLPYKVVINDKEYKPLKFRKRGNQIMEIGDELNVKGIELFIEDIYDVEDGYRLVKITGAEHKFTYITKSKTTFINVYRSVYRRVL